MQRKLSPRDEYLLQEKQRVKDSATLLERFQELKALTVQIAYFDAEDRGWQSRTTIGRVPCHTILRYTLNLEYQELVGVGSKP